MTFLPVKTPPAKSYSRRLMSQIEICFADPRPSMCLSCWDYILLLLLLYFKLLSCKNASGRSDINSAVSRGKPVGMKRQSDSSIVVRWEERSSSRVWICVGLCPQAALLETGLRAQAHRAEIRIMAAVNVADKEGRKRWTAIVLTCQNKTSAHTFQKGKDSGVCVSVTTICCKCCETTQMNMYMYQNFSWLLKVLYWFSGELIKTQVRDLWNFNWN